MNISKEFLEAASREIRVPSTLSDLEAVKKVVGAAIVQVARRNHRLDPRAIDIYMHGSYANNTNIYFPSNLEVVVEFKILRQPVYRLFNDYWVETREEFTPRDFTMQLLDELREIIGADIEHHGQVIILPPSKDRKHTVEITPAFTFTHTTGDGEFKGILVWDEGVEAHLATFPRIHQRNGEMQDKITRGNFLRMTRAFKTLNAIAAREGHGVKVRGYFIQCLLFNVPRNLYASDDLQTVFYSIFNYLMRADIRGFASQNLVWSLFGIAPEFWSLDDAHDYIKALKKYERKWPPERTELI